MNLPVDAIAKEAKFKKGEIANWREIQQGIFRAEVPVKRSGYTQAQAVPERILDDANQTLVLKLGFKKGPLYHFGEVSFVGLSPDLEKKAQQVWRMKQGDPFDFLYARDFFQKFSQVADLRIFKKVEDHDRPGEGEQVTDVVVTFQSK